jgi:hypothetical protein
MTDIRAQITEIAQRLVPLCRHVCVGDDERGPFMLAIAEDEVHSLELWHANGEFALELWHGATAEVEQVVDRLKLRDLVAVTERSASWLRPPMPSNKSLERTREG